MTRQLDVKPRHREQITRLLREHLPGVEVWAYGSRVNGRSHEGSDLDLALRGPGLAKIDTTQLAEFNEAVQESTIPFLVEARDWARLPESFHRETEREYVVLVEGEERVARGEWPTMSLREAGISLIDCEHRTPPAAEHGYPYVAIPQVKDGRINLSGVRRITHEHFDEWTRKANPESFDIVLSRRCNPGETGFVSEGLKFALGQNLVLLRSDGTKVLKPFLRWLVRGPRWWGQVDKYINVGAIFDSLKCADIPNFSLPIPPLPEQRAIAHIHGTLDDKIELNRRMNETLEEMARALFKSWFIDFDPVHAKAALRRHAAAQITPPLGGSRQAKGDSPQARRWGVARRHYPRRALPTARTLRKPQTDAEALLWYYIRDKQLDGHKFRRQQPIGPYIVDFACLSKKVLIELDGGQHAEQQTQDEARDHFLRNEGYRVLRFWNNEVFENCDGVLEAIRAAVQDPPPQQSAPDGLTATTPPQGGSDWTVERARAYLDGMDPSIAALFPDRFVDSELGEVPEGWRVGNLEDIAKHPRRGVQPNDINFGTSYIALEHMPKRSIALSEWNTTASVGSNKYEFRRGEFLFGKLRPYFHKVGIAPVAGVCSTDIVVVTSNAKLWSSFVLFCISSDEFIAYTDQTSTGTRMPRTSWKTMRQFEICLPTESLAALFQSIAQPMIDRILANCQESRALAILRDTLLPKLISGEVRVGDMERLSKGSKNDNTYPLLLS